MHFKYKDTNGIKFSVWGNECHANTNAKKAGVNILMSEQPTTGN